MASKICVITLSRDNPIELARTLASVLLQTERPTQHLVIDGSSPETAPSMRRLAERAGADYHWLKPAGIYSAMRNSVSLAEPDTYAWWLNSSDRMATPSSLSAAAAAIRQSTKFGMGHWVIGQLIRERGERHGMHPIGADGRDFVMRFQRGLVGFPHPSTLFQVSSLSSLDAYSGPLRIAEDYRLGLAFLQKYGPPAITRHPLAIHTADGFSYKRPIRHSVEKLRARFELLPDWSLAKEAELLVRNGPKTVAARITARMGPPLEVLQLTETNPSLHFCNERANGKWPRCCEAKLASYASI